MSVQQVLEDVKGWYNTSMARADPRVFDFPLAQTPVPIFFILIFYNLAVYHGPRIMEQYKPLQLKWVLVVYNFSMVAISFWVAHRLIIIAVRGGFSLVCQTVDYSHATDAIETMQIAWLFFFSKVLELADTMFFIVRKKNSQISFLHVYHHSTIVVVTWAGMKWVPGGNSFLYPLLNSLVHVVMYIYYGLAAIGPQMQKYLWWKKYLTMFQLMQFFIMIIHSGVNMFMKDCEFPKLFNKLMLAYAGSIMALFLNFYFRAYIQGRRPAPSVDKAQKIK